MVRGEERGREREKAREGGRGVSPSWSFTLQNTVDHLNFFF